MNVSSDERPKNHKLYSIFSVEWIRVPSLLVVQMDVVDYRWIQDAAENDATITLLSPDFSAHSPLENEGSLIPWK